MDLSLLMVFLKIFFILRSLRFLGTPPDRLVHSFKAKLFKLLVCLYNKVIKFVAQVCMQTNHESSVLVTDPTQLSSCLPFLPISKKRGEAKCKSEFGRGVAIIRESPQDSIKIK